MMGSLPAGERDIQVPPHSTVIRATSHQVRGRMLYLLASELQTVLDIAWQHTASFITFSWS
jgi:hypothetical protein